MSDRDEAGQGREDGSVTIMVIPEDGGTSRTYRMGPSRRRWLRRLAVVAGVAALAFLASWGYLAHRASLVPDLEARLAGRTAQDARVAELARNLEEVEAAYERLRALFGTEAGTETGELWLPPGRAGGTAAGSIEEGELGAPGAWPLTERGFISRTLLEDAGAGHPGIDVAVPEGSYVRASGSGTVVEAAEDSVYGRYLVIEHGDGYRTRYAHNSVILADSGVSVRRGEVVALTGSTGRSTAPHLHFEILRGDSLLDPLTLVSRP